MMPLVYLLSDDLDQVGHFDMSPLPREGKRQAVGWTGGDVNAGVAAALERFSY